MNPFSKPIDLESYKLLGIKLPPIPGYAYGSAYKALQILDSHIYIIHKLILDNLRRTTIYKPPYIID
jgi:hypothetical protein